MTEETNKIIKAIWSDICDRKGFDLNDLDPEVKREIRKEWKRIIQSILKER